MEWHFSVFLKCNKDFCDFNPSPNSYKYYGVVELNGLFARHGFKAEFFGDTPVGEASIVQQILRPVKKMAVALGVMPKSMAGKKFLKKIVFGGLMEMPVEIGPQITQITRINGRKKAQKAQECPQGKQSEKDDKTLYRGRYVEPDRISSDEANTSHKVIYCAATLDYADYVD